MQQRGGATCSGHARAALLTRPSLPLALPLGPQIVVFFPEASKVGVKEIKEMSEKMKVGGGHYMAYAVRWPLLLS